MKGRPNLPTHLRVVSGNAGKRSTDTKEPEVPIIDDTAPAHLRAEALEMWNKLFPLLARYVGLTELDKPKLEMYCAAYGRYRQAQRQIQITEIDGVTQEERLVLVTTYIAHGRNGKQIKTHPLYSQMIEEVRLMHSLGSELGLSMAARARLKGVGQGDMFDELDRLDREYNKGKTPPER